MNSKLKTWNLEPTTLSCILLLYPFNTDVNVIIWNPLHHWDVTTQCFNDVMMCFGGDVCICPRSSGSSHSEQRCHSGCSSPFYWGGEMAAPGALCDIFSSLTGTPHFRCNMRSRRYPKSMFGWHQSQNQHALGAKWGHTDILSEAWMF